MTATPKTATIPSWSQLSRHEVMPEVSHDEIARFNLLAQINIYLSSQLLPSVKTSYEKRTKPRFIAENGREPATRQEIRKAMLDDSAYQVWSALRRNTMEQRQQAGRAVVYRQLDRLNDTAKKLNAGKPTLQLDPSVVSPRYATAVDIHCMPGSYHTEVCSDDVSAAANYDVGIFVTTAGMLGSYSDGGGQAIAQNKTSLAVAERRCIWAGCLGPGGGVFSSIARGSGYQGHSFPVCGDFRQSDSSFDCFGRQA